MEDNTFEITTCRGIEPGVCRFAQPLPGDLTALLRETIINTGWPDFLNECHNNKIRNHNKFRISVSLCPNGCSRPHIADMGIISSAVPEITDQDCTACGLCASRCKDGAITVTTAGPEISSGKCLLCGHCADICSSGTITKGRTGLRILAGGKLGRRPMLAFEIPGLFTIEETVPVVDRSVRFCMENYRPGLRFRDSIEQDRAEFFEALK